MFLFSSAILLSPLATVHPSFFFGGLAGYMTLLKLHAIFLYLLWERLIYTQEKVFLFTTQKLMNHNEYQVLSDMIQDMTRAKKTTASSGAGATVKSGNSRLGE